MNQAEIKGPEIQRNRGFELSQLAQESQGQPVKTSNYGPRAVIRDAKLPIPTCQEANSDSLHDSPAAFSRTTLAGSIPAVLLLHLNPHRA